MTLLARSVITEGVGFGPHARARRGYIQVQQPQPQPQPAPVIAAPASSGASGRSGGGGGGGGFYWYTPPAQSDDPIWSPPSDLKLQQIPDELFGPTRNQDDELPPEFQPYFEQPREKPQPEHGDDEVVPGPWDLIARGIGEATRQRIVEQERERWQQRREQLEREFADRVAQIEAEHRAFVAQLQAKERSLDEAVIRFEALANQHIAWRREQERLLVERQQHAQRARQQYEHATQQASLAVAAAEQQTQHAMAQADAQTSAALSQTDQLLAQSLQAQQRAAWMLLGGTVLGLIALWILLRQSEE